MKKPKIVSSIEEVLSLVDLKHFQKHPHFHIIKLEDHFNKKNNNIFYQLDNVFEIAFSNSKNFNLFVDNTPIELQRDYLLFLSPGQNLRINSDDAKEIESAFIVYFTPHFLGMGESSYQIIKRFHFFNINCKSFFYPETELSVLYKSYMQKMHDEFKQWDNSSVEIIKALLSIILFETNRNSIGSLEVIPSIQTRKDIIAYQFENLVKQTHQKKQRLSFYASLMNLSKVYMCEAIKESTGKTASTILREYILLEATYLLNSTDYTIETIANELGFDDRSNFINYYKKYTTKTPGQVRKTSRL